MHVWVYGNFIDGKFTVEYTLFSLQQVFHFGKFKKKGKVNDAKEVFLNQIFI